MPDSHTTVEKYVRKTLTFVAVQFCSSPPNELGYFLDDDNGQRPRALAG